MNMEKKIYNMPLVEVEEIKFIGMILSGSGEDEEPTPVPAHPGMPRHGEWI